VTVSLVGDPETVDGEPRIFGQTDHGGDWQVTLMPDDALLFCIAPGGTMQMRAVPRGDWAAHLAVNESCGSPRSIPDMVHDLVSAQ
jgi:hypothetical protein